RKPPHKENERIRHPKAILDYLVLRHIFHYRNNSGAFKRDDGHFYRFGATGSPDIVCVIKGQYVGVEVKAPNGKQCEHQKAFQDELERTEGQYILAYSLEDVLNSHPTRAGDRFYQSSRSCPARGWLRSIRSTGTAYW